ncbi:MAG TPA: glycoside hydrolase family 5 protein [Flavitalea sp.]|nr:glycoside hydrolase family 5 protein [Flavitalea sp.]
MNKIQWISMILFLLASCGTNDKKNDTAAGTSDTASTRFLVKRGTNIAHWLSQSERRGEERARFFTEADIRFIDSAGFDHIRLPVDEMQLWDSTGRRFEDALQLLENCMSWCNKANLKVILDLHILRSHHFNEKRRPLWTDPKAQDHFIQLWKDLSIHVRKWPNTMVAYEFMNEPVADSAEEWNRLLSRVADSIRSWEPKRTLVIGSNKWQSAKTFDELRIPPNDPNILLSFHFYEPFHLTHFQAPWTDLKDFKGKVQYPGQVVVDGKTEEEKMVYNKDTLQAMMAKPIHLADSLHLPLYCGEFGVIENSPRDSKMRWYRDMVAIFDKNGIAYANWNYKSGSFGVVDENIVPDTTMLKILTGK